MTKVVTAEYDPETKTLTLNERLEGIHVVEEVKVKMPPPRRLADRGERLAVLRRLEGSITDATFGSAIDEMFPPWNDPSAP
jgi:hypothetical protein